MRQQFPDRLALLMPGSLLVRWAKAYAQPLPALQACPRADWLPMLALAGGFSLPSVTRAVSNALRPTTTGLPVTARDACVALLDAVEAWTLGRAGAEQQVTLEGSNVLAALLPLRGAQRLVAQSIHLLEAAVGDAAQGSTTAVAHLCGAVRFACLATAMEKHPALQEVAPVTLAHAVEVHFSRLFPASGVPPPLPRPRGVPQDVDAATLRAMLDALASWCPTILEPLLAA